MINCTRLIRLKIAVSRIIYSVHSEGQFQPRMIVNIREIDGDRENKKIQGKREGT